MNFELFFCDSKFVFKTMEIALTQMFIKINRYSLNESCLCKSIVRLQPRERND